MTAIPTTTQETIISPQRIEELVNNFILSLDVMDSSKKLYRRTLKQYFIWVDAKGYLLSEIARPQIIEYKKELLRSGKSSLTVGSYITSLKKFYEWTEANRYYPNVARGIKTPKRKQQFRKQPLQVEQSTNLLNHIEQQIQTPTGLRNFAIINLLIRTGLRTIELVRADVGDIVFKGSKRVLLVHAKGRDEKDQFVILTDKAYKPIEAYLSSREDAKDSEPLFISESNNNKGGRLSTRYISKIAKEYMIAIGINDKSYSAHSLRHTVGANILRAGGTLEMAQFTLRHSNPATTQIYIATLNEERRLQNSGEALVDSLF